MMNQTTHPAREAVTGATRRAPGMRQVCPFCGHVSDKPESLCAQCGMEDTPGTRQATRSKVGPWFVLQARNPSAPGMSHATLLALIEKGRVTARSVVRGPTTHQLWRFASRVKGVAREFGVCWGCGAEVGRAATLCPNCKRFQDPPANPDAYLEGQENATPAATEPPSDEGLTLAPSTQAPPPAPPAARVQLVAVPDASRMLDVAGFDLVSAGRPGRKVGQAVAVALVLCCIGVATVFFFSPDLRRQFSKWIGGTLHEVNPPPTQFRPAPPPATSPASRPAHTDAGPDLVTVSPRTNPPPATKPLVTPPTPDTVRISPPPPMTLEAAKVRAGELRQQAYEAARAGDWKRAVGCWEDMLRLPAEAQHLDARDRLQEARQQLGSPPRP